MGEGRPFHFGTGPKTLAKLFEVTAALPLVNDLPDVTKMSASIPERNDYKSDRAYAQGLSIYYKHVKARLERPIAKLGYAVQMLKIRRTKIAAYLRAHSHHATASRRDDAAEIDIRLVEVDAELAQREGEMEIMQAFFREAESLSKVTVEEWLLLWRQEGKGDGR